MADPDSKGMDGSSRPQERPRPDYQPTYYDLRFDPNRPELVWQRIRDAEAPWKEGRRLDSINPEKHRILLWVLLGAFFTLLFMVYLIADRSMALDPVTPNQAITLTPLEANPLSSADLLLRKAFGSVSANELLNFVRHNKRVAPLMTDYYTRKPFIHPHLDEVLALEPFDLDHTAFWLAKIRAADGAMSSVVLEDVDGEFKLDWETYVCYNPMEWSTFSETRPAGVYDFRVYAELGENFLVNGIDNASHYWARLTAKGSGDAIQGFANYSMDNVRPFRSLLSRDHKTPVILRLRFREAEASDQASVEIIELVQSDWLIK